jgi:hypothetical protein
VVSDDLAEKGRDGNPFPLCLALEGLCLPGLNDGGNGFALAHQLLIFSSHNITLTGVGLF